MNQLYKLEKHIELVCEKSTSDLGEKDTSTCYIKHQTDKRNFVWVYEKHHTEGKTCRKMYENTLQGKKYRLVYENTSEREILIDTWTVYIHTIV